jgi:hypothetical protein
LVAAARRRRAVVAMEARETECMLECRKGGEKRDRERRNGGMGRMK